MEAEICYEPREPSRDLLRDTTVARPPVSRTGTTGGMMKTVPKFGALLGMAAFACSAPYTATVTCKEPTAMEHQLGELNSHGLTFGKAFRMHKGKLVPLDDLVPGEGIKREPISDRSASSFASSFDLHAGANLPTGAQTELRALINANLKLELEGAVRVSAPGINWLEWVNTNNAGDETFKQLRDSMGAKPGKLYVVTELTEAKSMTLRYGADYLATVEAKAIQVADVSVSVRFMCSSLVEMKHAAPFYRFLAFNFLGDKFETAEDQSMVLSASD
jgi:hypothetical protein